MRLGVASVTFLCIPSYSPDDVCPILTMSDPRSAYIVNVLDITMHGLIRLVMLVAIDVPPFEGLL
ncbi:hypothetical protein EGR_03791 [Echinococcus granulosus]|uniref:Uncharacterized protein n=1 Tax=Echinococcus granulosus TaxID=6210 RepID=W6UIK3_ECHGR|nr:hypothetical protein EGR_03791 [Echinococcus granulosus]EUB61305.1 hypothetical protein EGR_03791 [Echinococcus granulosus]